MLSVRLETFLRQKVVGVKTLRYVILMLYNTMTPRISLAQIQASLSQFIKETSALATKTTQTRNWEFVALFVTTTTIASTTVAVKPRLAAKIQLLATPLSLTSLTLTSSEMAL
jgi:hypothetical protein